MANLTTSNSDFLFKLLQEQDLDEEAMLRDHALLAWAPNETDFTSHLGKVVAVEYVNPQGAGTTEALAAATRNPSAGVKFTVPQRHYTMNAGIERVVLQNAAAGGSDSEFADALVNEIDGISEQFGDHLERQMWGSYLGYRGTVASFTSTTLTLTNAADAQLFEVNQYIQTVDPAGPTVRTGTGAGYALITKINRSTGVLTFTQLDTDISTIANADLIVGRGDFTNNVFNGLPDWVPTTVATNDSFLGVNRSTDRDRLAGIYYDGSAKSIRNACISGVQRAKAYSGPKFRKNAPCFMHPFNMQKLIESVETAKVVSIELKTSYGVGIEAIEIMGHRYVEAYGCPINNAFIVGEGAFVRGSSGKQPQINAFGQGNSGFHYEPDTGLLTFSSSHDGNTYSRKPYQLLRIALPAYAD
jgi:hypothetical protein